MQDATRVLRDVRDRTVIVDALCGAMVGLAVSLSSPQLEVLAVEAQRSVQQNLVDVHTLLDLLRTAAA